MAENSRQHDIGVANDIRNREPQICAADLRRGESRYVDAVENPADLPPETPTAQTQTLPVSSSTAFIPQRSTRSMK